jgi:predicted adenylyl cyclase CyaB
MKNIEIKARVDRLDRPAEQVRGLGFCFCETLEQEDVYFTVPRGRLKLRLVPARPGQLIFYERPNIGGPKESVYEIVQVEEGRLLAALLGTALGVKGKVVKTRQVFLRDNIRLHLDQVEGVGSFLELEAVIREHHEEERATREITNLLSYLGIPPMALMHGSYIDLLLARSGTP